MPNKDQLISLGRGLLKAAGGALVANGVNMSSVKQVVTGVVVALVGFVFSHLTHSNGNGNGNSNDTGSKKPINLLLLLIPLIPLVIVGCTSFTTNVFRAQQTSENLVYTGYIGYTQYLGLHLVDPGMSNQIKEARLKFAATDRTIDSLRLSYDTNSTMKPQLEAAILTLQDQASNVVWLVHYFQLK